MNLGIFFAELRRRRVIRVAAAYLVAAWAVIQVAGTVLPMLEAPVWVGKVALALVVLGFPVALALSWAFDLTWEGIQRTEELPPSVPGSTLLPRLVLLALMPLVVGGGWLAWRWAATPEVSLDARVVAVLPFRVAGAEPSLAYLREGMLDLLAAKLTGEAGPRAVDPRTLTSAWRRSTGDANGDLSREEALALARRLGAGRLVLGEVVSLSGRVVLTASLHDVRSGRTDAPVSVEGPPDSLPSLVDQLVVGLLSVGAGEGERLASLTTTSLPALRLYLEGQAAYRGGRYDEAFAHFSRAVELDSTFALGAFMVSRAAGWLTDQRRAVGPRALALAWEHRERLGARDREVLATLAGPNYPGFSSTADRLASLEALVRSRPDDPEAWFWLGDEIFHGGTLVDIPDSTSLRRAADAFSRAIALDSLYLPALGHLFDVASLRGDTASMRRLAGDYLARDPDGLHADLIRNLLAARIRGMEGIPEVLARLDSASGPAMVFTLSSLLLPEAMPLAWRIEQHLGSRVAEPGVRQSLWMLYRFAMEAGRHTEAARYTELRRRQGQFDSTAHLVQRVRDGLYWDGEPEAIARAAAALSADVGRIAAGGRQGNIACVLGQWHLMRGETAEAAPHIERLRALGTGSSSNQDVTLLPCAELLETWRAVATSARDADAHLARLDSLLSSGSGETGGRLPFEGNLVLARLQEGRGDHAGALRTLRRLPPHPSDWEAYGATFLRERGRLAALLGDTAAAVEAYRYYVALRAQADPPLQPEVERVRAELARLTGGRSR